MNQRHKVIADLVKRTEYLNKDMAELGVFQGETSRIILENSHTRWLWCIDTFKGIPHVNEFDTHKVGDFENTSVEHVIKQLNSVCKPPRFTIVAGTFPQCIPSVMQKKLFSFVHIDADVYESYMEALKFFYPRMFKGGIILFDDYHALTCLGAKKAVDEFLFGKPEIICNTEWKDSAYIVKMY